MRHEFREVVLTYGPEELARWKSGDKWLIPPFAECYPIVKNQPAYHFGEYFTFDHFYRSEGWKGFRFFVLNCVGDYEYARYGPGGRKIEQMVGKQRLEQFRVACEHMFAGEPDLFLYKDSGEMLFLETKKGEDRINETQLRCLAHIRSILGARAEIVYLCEAGEGRHDPRTYWIEIDDLRPARVVAWGVDNRKAKRVLHSGA
jgi:hypothetical protein